MILRSILTAALGAALAALPAVALADLHVTGNGFHRVVASTTNGAATCTVHRDLNNGSVRVRCPADARGTMTFYRHTSEGPVCELDFWPQNTPSVQKWRAQLSHQNASLGTCSLQWTGNDMITINVQ